jgi:hypothetical protein
MMRSISEWPLFHMCGAGFHREADLGHKVYPTLRTPVAAGVKSSKFCLRCPC